MAERKKVDENSVKAKTSTKAQSEKTSASATNKKVVAKTTAAKKTVSSTAKKSATKTTTRKTTTRKTTANKTIAKSRKNAPKTETQTVAKVKYERADDPQFNADLKYDYINASKPTIQLTAALAYILFFIPFCWNRNEKFAMYHCNQGLVLFIFAISAYIISIALIFVWQPLGLILLIVSFAVCVIYTILGICNASDGKAEPLPLIGKIKIIDWTKAENH